MGKIISRNLLSKLLKNDYAGKTVVFTNGCFDLLHIGHVRLLKAAASCGDVLVVGINADESVKRLKGKSRPIVPEAERAEVISSLDCVDFVTLFGEDTPVDLIALLKPDVYVKGGDYDMNLIPESEVIKSYGGKSVSFPFVDGHSSSDIVKRVLKAYEK